MNGRIERVCWSLHGDDVLLQSSHLAVDQRIFTDDAVHARVLLFRVAGARQVGGHQFLLLLFLVGDLLERIDR